MSEIDGIEAYRRAGVDLLAGNEVSSDLGAAARATWPGRAGRIGEVVEYGSGFTSFRGMPLDAIGAVGLIQGLASDGVGTKVELAERMGNHGTIAHDLVAMAVDDTCVRGGEAYAVATVLDVRSLDVENRAKLIAQIAQGYAEAAAIADVTILDGETAELGSRVGGYGPFNYNWSATASWLVHRSRIIDGSNIAPGDSLVAFREHGLRSNGLSLIRNVFSAYGGNGWHNELVNAQPDAPGRRIGELALKPSIIYNRLMVDLTGGMDLSRESRAQVHGAAHITGGGIPEKLGRILRGTGFGAEIPEPFEPPYIMQLAQERHRLAGMGPLSDEAAYRTWNMGQGMVVVTPQAQEVIEVAQEHGIDAQEIGVISREPGIRIHSQGLDAERLEFAA